MIEDATKPIIEPFELYDDCQTDLSEVHISVERSTESVLLNLKDAAYLLGKSMRALERSLSGKWGNKLPDGWSAKKIIVNDSEEWQIMPPAGFNLDGLLEHKRSYANRSVENGRKS